MAIKVSYSKQEDIPTAHVDLYTEKGGKWYLTEVEGIKTSEDVSRISSALDLEKKEHSATKKKWEAVTTLGHGPDEVVRLLEEHGEFKVKIEAGAGDKFDEEKFNKAVQSRVDAHQVRWERERKQLLEKVALGEETNKQLSGTITSSKLESQTRKACEGLGMKPSAIADAVLLSERVMQMNESGEFEVKDKVGYTPGLGITEFMEDRKTDRTHWWEESKGGGSKTKNGAPVVGNPWERGKNFNMAAQGEILRKDPELAKRLAAEHGQKIGA